MATDKSIADIAARLERIETALSFYRPPSPVDPSPDDPGRGGVFGGGRGGGGGWNPHWWIADPVPIDIGRLTRAQLLLSLESIKAQRIRLDGIENVIQLQLKQQKG
jgi:hypothetical protein